MREFRPGVAANIDNRDEKKEVYRAMATATYPMLYALSADLSTYDPSIYHGNFPAVFRRPGLAVGIKSSTREFMEISLGKESIQTAPSRYKVFNDLGYDVTAYSQGLHNLTATTSDDKDLYQFGMMSLVDAIGKIGQGNSQTVSVAEEFATRFPDMDSRFALKTGQIAVMDGLFSTYRAATWLSQMPIQGLEALPTRERLLAILRSNTVTDFTKKVDISVLAKLPTMDFIPQQQTIGTTEMDLQLHPDTERFVELFNPKEARVVPQRMICPFAVPLGVVQAERTISEYSGSLSIPIMAMIRENAQVSGIKTTGIAIAGFLESRI